MKLSYPHFPANWNISLALMLSAAAALIYESGATQVLFYYFTESSYSLATVLGVFLGGLGLGSFIFYKLSSRVINQKRLFGLLQTLTSVYGFLVLTHLSQIIPQISPLGIFLVSGVILIVPATFFGAIFPLAVSIFKNGRRDSAGLVYSIDLLGSIIGALAVGFLVIPTYGVAIAMALGAALNLVSAVIAFSLPIGRMLSALTISAVLILAYASIGGSLGSTLIVNGTAYEFYKNSPFGPVTVLDGSLSINLRTQCSFRTGPGYSVHDIVPDAINPLVTTHKNLDVLNIGLGCGGTVGRILDDYPDIKVDVVEINQVVVESARKFSNVLSNQRVHLIVDDGLHYLRDSNKKYDSILLPIDNPLLLYLTPLYTIEAFRTEANSLADGGTLALRTLETIYNSQEAQVTNSPAIAQARDIIYYTLKEVFPYVYRYPGAFVASRQVLAAPEYSPSYPRVINTVDRNALTALFRYQFNDPKK